ncbi:MAG: hypothetical protein ACKVT1_11295 [Dehalococcoidia bacterium]
MAVKELVWRLASPYDAYVSHVARLTEAMDRIRALSEMALGHEAGLQSSVRYVPGMADTDARAARFREQLGAAAERMGDEEFEEFIQMLGGGAVASVESNRAQAVTRLSHTTRGLEEYFAIAGQELSVLEKRGYNPGRTDIARQLRENRLPPVTVDDYRHQLHLLGTRVGQRPAE